MTDHPPDATLPDQHLREHLRALLGQRQAHATFEDAVKHFPASELNVRPHGLPYSAWELLEHLRFTQRDLLNFLRDPAYTAPKWPDDYWPGRGQDADAAAWQTSVDAFSSDHAALVALLDDPQTDLLSPIPWGEGQTPLRELLLAADHNAYHIGELVLLRRLLGAWPA